VAQLNHQNQQEKNMKSKTSTQPLNHCIAWRNLLGMVVILSIVHAGPTSVKAQDVAGAKLTNQVPVVVTSGGGPLNTIRVTFDEAIDPASFTPEDVTLYGPTGSLIPVTVLSVSGTGDTQFDLAFANQTVRGVYRLTVGPNVTDLAGNPMNQNGNGVNGEPADAYNGTVWYASTVATIPFTETFEAGSVGALGSYWSFACDSGTISVTTNYPHSGSYGLQMDAGSSYDSRDATLHLSLAGQTNVTLDFWVQMYSNALRWGGSATVLVSADGGANWTAVGNIGGSGNYEHYSCNLDSLGLTYSSDVQVLFRYSSGYYTGGFAWDDIRVLTNADVFGAAVTNQVPAGLVAGPVGSVVVTFNEVVDAASFGTNDVTVTGPAGGLVPLAGVSDLGDHRSFRIDFASPQRLAGTYTLTVGPDVLDVAGNPMDQNGDALQGDAYNGSFQVAAGVAGLPFVEAFEAGSVGALGSYWSFARDSGTISVTTNHPHSGSYGLQMDAGSSYDSRDATLHLSLAGQTNVTLDFWVQMYSNALRWGGSATVLVSADGGANWTAVGNIGGSGNYEHYSYNLDSLGLTYSSDVQVLFRYSSGYYTGGFAWDDIRVLTNADVFGAAVTNQVPAVVASYGGPLNTIRVTFDETIDPASFTPGDVTLYGPMGGLIPVTVSAVGGSGNAQFDLGFTDQTVRGVYRLTVGPNVTDMAGNPMNQNEDVLQGDGYIGTVSFESIPLVLGTNSVLFTEGFESWPPVPDYWSFGTVGDGTVSVVTNDSPQSGSQHLQLFTDIVNQSQWVVLTLSLTNQAGATDLFLDFWAKTKDWGSPAYSTFYVEVSGDGTNWWQVLYTAPPTSYQNYLIDLGAQLAAGGITPGSNLYIRFRNTQTYLFPGAPYTVFLDQVRITKGSPTFLLSVAPSTFPENAGSAAAYGTIKRINSTNLAESLVVTLAGPTNALILPDSITIAPNNSETNFLIGAVDDGVLAGSRQATITASATGFTDAAATVSLLEATPAQIGLTLLGTSVSEAAGVNALSGFVTRDRGLDADLVVNLSSSDTSKLTTPSSVTIPAGSTTAFFTLDTQDDGEIDGTQTVTISASAPGYASSAVNVQVTDDDSIGHRTIGGHVAGTLDSVTYQVTQSVIVDSNAVLTIPAGTRLLFEPGTTLNVVGTLLAQGQPGNEITLTSLAATPAPGDWTGIQFAGFPTTTSLLDHVNISFAQNGIDVLPGTGARLLARNSVIVSNSQNGVNVALGAGDYITDGPVVIEGCRIAHNQNGIYLGAQAWGCDWSANYTTVVGSLLFSNSGAGIRIYATGSGTGCIPFGSVADVGSRIEANVISYNTYGIWASGEVGYLSHGVAEPNVLNNLILSNTSHALLLEDEFYGTIRNNTIVGNMGYGVQHSLDSARAPVTENNIIFGNLAGMVATSPVTNTPVGFNDVANNPGGNWVNYPAAFGSQTTVNRNGTAADVYQDISADPLFVATDDFHLQASSPCVNAGDSTNAPASDFEGQPRGLFPDIGYDEVLIQPVLLSPVVLSDGHLRMTIIGEPGLAFTLQGTPDLFYWADLGSYTNQTGTLVLTNVPPAGQNAYFYRTVFR
jgi:hypothetical protein